MPHHLHTQQDARIQIDLVLITGSCYNAYLPQNI